MIAVVVFGFSTKKSNAMKCLNIANRNARMLRAVSNKLFCFKTRVAKLRRRPIAYFVLSWLC